MPDPTALATLTMFSRRSYLRRAKQGWILTGTRICSVLVLSGMVENSATCRDSAAVLASGSSSCNGRGSPLVVCVTGSRTYSGLHVNRSVPRRRGSTRVPALTASPRTSTEGSKRPQVQILSPRPCAKSRASIIDDPGLRRSGGWCRVAQVVGGVPSSTSRMRAYSSSEISPFANRMSSASRAAVDLGANCCGGR